MYLKEIKAQGFKSFADKISIELSNNITGIVGPNGSGKSNVVDAVRWVLGEQSVKSLRGTDNMTDVIFQGSKSRSGQNVASVTLVFDNTDKYLNISYDEVAIKRRVYRDGTNEYFINNEKCRLKDIIEIMLDTGIAKESFNIISQGKIEDCLASLEKACHHAIEYDKAYLGDHGKSYTSIFTDKLIYPKTDKDFHELTEHTRCYHTLEKMQHKRYDSIRQVPRFISIIEKLKQYAK